MKRLVPASILIALALPGIALAGAWKIDPAHSSVGFKIRHFFSKVPGAFTEFGGTIEFDPEKPEEAKVEVVIQAASIDTDHEKRDGHLRSEDFFWAEEHPEITFTSTAVKAGEEKGTYLIEGLLSMRGVEKPVTLKAEFLGAGPDAWGGTRAGFTAAAEINRKEWNIEWNQVLDQGGAMLGDDVAINLEIEAVLQKEESGE